MKEYVIIGGGVASVGCIEGIRSVDTTSAVTVISAEAHSTYCRPLISYLLEGKTDREKMKYRPDSFYEKNNCSVIYGKSCIEVNGKKHTVTVSDGRELTYTALCAATGSSPLIPPIEGLGGVERKFTFMTLDDACALDEAISSDSRVLIIGAGLIGLKCAEAIGTRVASVTVCDLSSRVLSSVLDDECAEVMQRHMETHNIRFMLCDSAVRLDKSTAYMKSGATVDFDILVLAVGVSPNTAVLERAGVMCERGILTDLHMRTSLDGVYAAGDCACGFDASAGESRVTAIMPNAYMQGYCAGVNMAGGDEVFDRGILMNAAGFFGLHAMSAGTRFADGEEYKSRRGDDIVKLFIRGGVLTGFILIGETERAGIYTSLVRNRTALEEINLELLKKSPTLAAFSQISRRKILGGAV